MIDKGIVINGVILPHTEWVLRDPRGWWDRGEYGTRKRTGRTTLLVGHWTAGGPKRGDSTAKVVVRNMKARKRTDGSRLEVGIHFVIGWDGKVFQTADLGIATVHVGDRSVIDRSIGVETTWPGTMAQAKKLGVPGSPIEHQVAGALVQAMTPSPELLASWVRLANALASLGGDVAIPKRVPALNGAVRRTRFTPPESLTYAGAQEHFHVPPPTKKRDAAGILMDALVADGWALGG